MLEFKALRNKQEFEKERGLLKEVKESEKINENAYIYDIINCSTIDMLIKTAGSPIEIMDARSSISVK
jgi:hypothetical protein